jgi:hypothetical protein
VSSLAEAETLRKRIPAVADVFLPPTYQALTTAALVGSNRLGTDPNLPHTVAWRLHVAPFPLAEP